MRARVGLVLACLGYSALALGSGLDRASAGSPKLADRIPGWFASEALRARGAEALAKGQAQAAMALGSAAIDDAPTDPQSPALLAAGRLASGDRGGADRAFRVAGKLGWRVPVTQIYWMNRALAANDYRIAAMRLDALLRQQPAFHRQRELIDPMERNPAGRSALVERMAAGPIWLRNYAGDVHDLPVDVMLQRAPVLEEAAQRGLVLGCPLIAATANRLVVLDQVRTGSTLWRAHCPAAGSGLVGDGTFTMAGFGTPLGAFSWELLGSEGVTLGIVPSPDGPGQRLTFQGTVPRTRAVLSQLLSLAPGRYVLSWRSNAAKGTSLRASLACKGTEPPWLDAQRNPTSGRMRATVAIDETCTAQVLLFGFDPDGVDTWLEDVRIEAAGP